MAQERIGRYSILEEIASGAQGTVYRAHDPDVDRTVALKVLHPEMARDPQYVERFRREARIAASIDHPNVCRIYEVGEVDGRHFIAMEFLPASLSENLRHAEDEQGGLPVEIAATFAAQIAEGVAAAHASGIVHRDIKPQNILFSTDGTAKVTDFGIARAESLTTMTATGLMMGTPHYMAPELVHGERADEQSDTYALGCVLYQMLAGEVPFSGTTPMVVLNRHVNEQPQPIRDIRRDVPRALAGVVGRAMEKDPARRFGSAAEMAVAIRKAAGLPEAPAAAEPRPELVEGPGEGRSADLYETPVAPRRRRRSWRLPGRSVAVVIAGSVTAVVLAILFTQQSADSGTSTQSGPSVCRPSAKMGHISGLS